MSAKEVTSKQYFLLLKMVYFQMFIFQVGTLCAFLFSILTRDYEIETNKSLFFYFVVGVLMFVGFFVDFVISTKKFDIIREKITLEDKLKEYRVLCIVRYNLLGAQTLFGVVLFMISNNYHLLLLVAPLFVYYIMIRPTKTNLCVDLELTLKESEFIENPASVLIVFNK